MIVSEICATAVIALLLAAGQPEAEQALQPFDQEVPASAAILKMMPVPASEDGSIGPLWVCQTETPWEAMDVYVYGFDVKEGEPADAPDAVSRPSKPYIPPDRGFGHEGYAAISVTYRNANGFCEWLSARTGKHYRLPTVEEWQHICSLSGIDTSSEDAVWRHAWFRANAEGTPHRIASKDEDDLGLFDLVGNVSEWCISEDGKGRALGGSFQSPLKELGCEAMLTQTREWNETDPQIPKSPWWLSDAPFVGFRIICDPNPKPETPETATETKP